MSGPRRALGIAALLLGAGAASACAGAPPPGGIGEIGEIAMVLASYEVPFEVAGGRTEVSIDVPADLSERKAAAARAAGTPYRVGLVLHAPESPRGSGVYDLYAGVPAGADPDPGSPWHLGTLAPFGPSRDPDPGDAGGPLPSPPRASYDLTRLVTKLEAEGRWGSSLELTFVLREPEPAEGVPVDAGPIPIDVVRVVRWRR